MKRLDLRSKPRLFTIIAESWRWLFVAASPGLGRLLLLGSAAWLFGAQAAGPLSSDLSVMYFVGFVTSMGWATALLARVGASEAGPSAELKSHVAGALLSTLLCVPLLWLPGFAVTWRLELAIALGGYAVYQCVRSLAIAYRKAALSIVLDLIIHLVPCLAAVALAGPGGASPRVFLICLALALVIGPISVLRVMARDGAISFGKSGSGFSTTTLRAAGLHALPTGFAMLLTSGMAFTFVPLVLRSGTPADATVAALFVNMLAALSVIPRALTIRDLPRFSMELKSDPAQARLTFRRFRCGTRIATCAMGAVGGAGLVAVWQMLPTHVGLLVTFLTIGALIPMAATAEIHCLIAKGRSAVVFWTSALCAAPYFVGLLLYGACESSKCGEIMVELGIIYVMGNLIRTVVLLSVWRQA